MNRDEQRAARMAAKQAAALAERDSLMQRIAGELTPTPRLRRALAHYRSEIAKLGGVMTRDASDQRLAAELELLGALQGALQPATTLRLLGETRVTTLGAPPQFVIGEFVAILAGALAESEGD